MIHNLTPVAAKVYMVYEIDFIPATSPAASGIKPVAPGLDGRENGSVYPVFDVKKGAGTRAVVTPSPTTRRTPTAAASKRNEWTVDRDGVLMATAGHLHPGGLHTDL